MKLATTLGGAGVMNGALTPECAEFVTTVLDALSAPSGADDDRTHEQRYHDALQEAMRRLVAADLVPRRAGQPLKVWAYISLADLMRLPGSAELVAEWARQLSALWAGRQAAAAGAGGHQGLWLDGAAARGIACGAPVTPVIVGDVNPAAFGDLIRLCAQLDKLQHGGEGSWPFQDQPGRGLDGDAEDDSEAGGSSSVPDAPASEDAAADGAAVSRQALLRAIIGKAAELLSGPGGWPRSCAASSSAIWVLAGPACPSTSGTATRSPPTAGTPSGSATGTASGPAGATSRPGPARSTTPSPGPTAARPVSGTAFSSAISTTRS